MECPHVCGKPKRLIYARASPFRIRVIGVGGCRDSKKLVMA